ncbi:MAG: phosphatidate cytidylyltransferase [Planctomycetes bacterium]|nr:phosphatidate cytidylyltransferase [Planctomycetota bacterium]
MSVLRQRVISGSLLGVGIFVLMMLDAWLAARPAPDLLILDVNLSAWLCHGAISTLILLVLSALAAKEVTHFVRQAGYRPNRAIVQLFAAGLVIGPYISFNLRQGAGWYDESWGMLWVSIALGLAFLLQAVRRGTEHATINVASAIFIIVYTGGLAGYLTRLRMEIGGYEGTVVLLFSVFLVKANDIGAFFTGTAFGKHKLIPWLSPKKTWEGFVGGLVVTVILSVLLGRFLPDSVTAGMSAGPLAYPWGFVWFGLLMGLLSVAGDLVASLLKRDAAVKDSGEVIPGMGGVLDILDSPLLAAPAAWFFWTRIV